MKLRTALSTLGNVPAQIVDRWPFAFGFIIIDYLKIVGTPMLVGLTPNVMAQNWLSSLAAGITDVAKITYGREMK